VFGKEHTFPHVNSARYGSLLAAIIELLLNRTWYLKFMQEIHDSKTTPGFTNLESNAVAGLLDIPTLTEMCAAALYCELVDRPYMTYVRTRDAKAPLNALDLGPFHDTLLDYTKRVSEDCSIILQTSASLGSTGLPRTFNGLEPECPEVFYCVYAHAQDLPHLSAMVSAFFQGAHDKLIKFTQEFAKDGTIAKMTAEQRAAAFIDPTNDVNEGALGVLRIAMRRMPHLSLGGLNQRMMLWKNDAAAYYKNCSSDEKARLRSQARIAVKGEANERRRKEFAIHQQTRALENAQKAAEKEKKKAEKKAHADERMHGVQVVTDLHKISKMKGADLDLQLEWHRRRGILDEKGRNVVPGMSGKRVHEKRWVLYGFAISYKVEYPEHEDIDQDLESESAMDIDPAAANAEQSPSSNIMV
jgi:hypothetical protein